MTPIDKAFEIMKMFSDHCKTDDQIKTCAIYMVDNLINTSDWTVDSINGSKALKYWKDVKEEILNA